MNAFLKTLVILSAGLNLSAAPALVTFDCAGTRAGCAPFGKTDAVATALVSKGVQDVIFGNSFEGFSILGGRISGRVYADPNADGDLTDGVARGDVSVYLDANYNGRFDTGELTRITAADGFYEFAGLPAGVYHVRQQLLAPNIQTNPGGGLIPVSDMLPDEVFNYTHPDPGVGQFDQAYGKMASQWPGDWNDLHSNATSGTLPELVDVDLVLKPLGVRNAGVVGTRNGHEALSLPLGARIMVRFDEVIVDGPGADFIVYALSTGTATEQAEILVGSDPLSMVSLGIFPESVEAILVDLQDFGVSGPVRYVEVVGQDVGGTWWGFELTGFEAINVAGADPGAHIVTINPQAYVFNDRDFGRYAQDLAPSITLGFVDNDPGTPELRAGESITVQVNAYDDVAITDVNLIVDGQAVSLDANSEAVIALQNPGEIQLRATATDSAAQVAAREAQIYVVNSDGSLPFDPNLIGQSEATNSNAPVLRILAPAAGASLVVDVEIVASITSTPAPTSWTLEYAQVDLIDPYDLASADIDYIQIASGSGSLVSSPLGILPLTSLPDDIYFVRLSAQNSPGQIAYFGQVVAKNIAQANLRPTVNIDGPASGVAVSITADITGTVNSTRTLVEWFVDYAPADSVDLNNLGSDAPAWRRISSGTNTVPISSTLANFDATVVRNGSYIVRVVARNDIGLGWVEPLALEVVGDAKLGRNRLEFTDLQIDLAGFPLQFVRVYDSLSADQDGELGFGWSLQLRSSDIGETVPDTGLLGIFGATPFRVGTRVYVTAPTGERLGFSFQPELGVANGFGQPYHVVFTADPGNYFRLEVPQGDQDFIQIGADGNAYLFPIAFPYNPESYVLITPAGLRYTMHEDRGVLKAEDPNGNSLTFDPDFIQHSAGPRLEIGRDSNGRIIDITDPEGNVWLIGYDAAGDLVSFSDPDGNTSVYSYLASSAHYLDTVFDPQGRMPRRFEYDPISGRKVAEIDEAGNRRESLIDPQGFAGLSTDARGNTTYIEYDARGNTTLLQDPYGNQITYEYNDPANPDKETRLIDSNGEFWNYQYNAMGLPTRLSTPLANFASNRYDVSYDALGNVSSFNDLDRRLSTYTYDAQGNRLSEVPAIGVSSTFTYGASGQLQRRNTADAGFSVSYGYDADGYISSQVDPSGYLLQMTNLENGRLVQRSDNTGSLDVGFTAAGLLSTQTDAQGNSTSLVENADGSLTRTDRVGNSLTQSFNANKQPVAIDLAAGGQLLTSYDADGNPDVVTDPVGNTLSYNFDKNNRLIGIQDHLGNADSFVRDGNGDITQIVDRNGKQRSFLRDANRRITNERWHDTVGTVVREIVYTYNGFRGLIQVDDTQAGQSFSLVYAGTLPQVSSVDYVLPGQAAWRLRYSWNKKTTAPVRVRAGIGNTTASDIVVTPFGGQTYRLDWTHPGASGGGNEVQFYPNPNGTISRIVRITGTDGGDAVSESDFSYDTLGGLLSVRHVDEFGTLLHPRADLAYTRDPEGRLETATHAFDSVDYGFDAENQLVSASHSNPLYADELYSYDLAGNRLSSHLAPALATITAPNRVSVSGDFGYEFDLAGNLTRRTDNGTGEVVEFSYDHRNRLVSASTHPSLGAPANDSLEFEYDYLDRMIYRVINGAKTWILHDRNQPVAEFSDAATEIGASFLYDPAVMDDYHAVWRAGTAGERWFLKDQLGSIRGITDAAFNVLSWVDYDAFGNLQPGSAPAMDEPLRFAGRTFISELGLYDNRRRFYDPMLGRFTQEDPLKHGGLDHHFYRYVLNDPTALVDPSGTSAAVALINILVEVSKAYKMANDAVGGKLELPCSIARASAAGFGYFVPMADILRDPSIAVDMPNIEPVNLLAGSGCSSK